MKCRVYGGELGGEKDDPRCKGLLTWEESSVERFAVVQSLNSDRGSFFKLLDLARENGMCGLRKWNVWPEAK